MTCDACFSAYPIGSMEVMLFRQGRLQRGHRWGLCPTCYRRFEREIGALLQRIQTAPRPATTEDPASPPGSSPTSGVAGA